MKLYWVETTKPASGNRHNVSPKEYEAAVSYYDRYIIRQFLVNFVILLCVMMMLFTVVDMILNLDEFLEAGRLRLRPILMTSIAFIMGVVPMVFSSGAGAEMRQAMGVAVFAGMIGVTIFGLILTPLFYYALAKRRDRQLAQAPVAAIEDTHHA